MAHYNTDGTVYINALGTDVPQKVADALMKEMGGFQYAHAEQKTKQSNAAKVARLNPEEIKTAQDLTTRYEAAMDLEDAVIHGETGYSGGIFYPCSEKEYLAARSIAWMVESVEYDAERAQKRDKQVSTARAGKYTEGEPQSKTDRRREWIDGQRKLIASYELAQAKRNVGESATFPCDQNKYDLAKRLVREYDNRLNMH